jgi:dolichol-phosphate mannosyltransferase
VSTRAKAVGAPSPGAPSPGAPPRGATPLSVIMPAYNEEEGIREAVGAVQAHVLTPYPGAELVVVNDGSRDSTGALLDEIAAADPRVRVVHKANGGHGPAIMRGLSEARGDFVFLIDSDNQIPMEAFGSLWREVEAGHDGVFGVRRVRHDAEIRRVLTALIRASLRMLFGVSLYDANVPYKLLRRSLWQEARRHIPDGTLAPSLFLAVFVMRRQCDIAFVDVPHKDRETGTVSIRRWKLIKFCWRAFRQLLQFRTSLQAT